MAPPANSVDLKAAKKGNKSNSKDEKATGVRAGDVKRGDEKMMRAMEDERFASARTDPMFRPMRWKDAKVALDSRFNRILTEPMFASAEAPVDKRGRRRKKGARENPMLHCYLDQKEEDQKEKERERSWCVQRRMVSWKKRTSKMKKRVLVAMTARRRTMTR